MSKGPVRRVPRQARAEQRVKDLLATAEAMIAEVGYDATTLTAIAKRAGASIGSLYQYFPDKLAVASALADKFGADLADRWAPLLTEAASFSLIELVDRIMEVMIRFQIDHPAFLSLVSEIPGYRHSDFDRSRLRVNVTTLLQVYRSTLRKAEASAIAEVIIQLLKAMNHATESKAAREKNALVEEFRLVFLSYLTRRLQKSPTRTEHRKPR
jgi:AcrR family transcriptional regulator